MQNPFGWKHVENCLNMCMNEYPERRETLFIEQNLNKIIEF